MRTILFVACEQIKNISILLNPIIPISTNKVLDTLNVNPKKRLIKEINNLKCFEHDKELKDSDILFNKIENDN